jgi:hypothetical protein
MRCNNGAMAHGVPCVNGNADRIRSANYETLLKLKIFFGSDRSSFHAPKFGAPINLRVISGSASLFVKLIAYSFCWRERKRKYVSQWQTACSKRKWTSIAKIPDLYLTTVNILTHLISRYQLPLMVKNTLS